MNLRPHGKRKTVTCDRCGRIGKVNFRLVEQFADGSEQWRCVHDRPCMARRRLTERLAAARGSIGGG